MSKVDELAKELEDYCDRAILPYPSRSVRALNQLAEHYENEKLELIGKIEKKLYELDPNIAILGIEEWQELKQQIEGEQGD